MVCRKTYMQVLDSAKVLSFNTISNGSDSACLYSFRNSGMEFHTAVVLKILLFFCQGLISDDIL